MCSTTGKQTRVFFYFTDFQFAADVLDPIIFADGTKFLYSHKDINALFFKVNNQLHNSNQCFISNKLSFNVKKQNG